MILALIHFVLLSITIIFNASYKRLNEQKDYVIFVIVGSLYLSFWFYVFYSIGKYLKGT